MWSTGTEQLSKYRSEDGMPRKPIKVSRLPKDRPAVSFGT